MKNQNETSKDPMEEKPKINKRGKYEEPLKIKGTFLDIIKAVVNDAEKNGADKRRKKH